MVLLEWARPGGRRPTLARRVRPGHRARRRRDARRAGIVRGQWRRHRSHRRRHGHLRMSRVVVGLDLLPPRAAADVGVHDGRHSDAGRRRVRRRHRRRARRARDVRSVGAISMRSFLAWLYLLVFGSLIGFTAFVYLLRVSTPARVADLCVCESGGRRDPGLAVRRGVDQRSHARRRRRSSSPAWRSSRRRRGARRNQPQAPERPVVIADGEATGCVGVP